MDNPIRLTYGQVLEAALPKSPERDEAIARLNVEESDDTYTRRTIRLLIDISLALASKNSEA